jgi:hypothetical protein
MLKIGDRVVINQIKNRTFYGKIIRFTNYLLVIVEEDIGKGFWEWRCYPNEISKLTTLCS